jgi:signal transduction histidine kinase
MNVPDDYELKTNLPYLQQVMVHLINNAIKFTEQGSVEFGCFPDENQRMVFYVKDTGIGIPKEKQATIFQVFEKASTLESHIYPGMGLGLTIAAKIIESPGGRIWFESHPSRGTCFYFNL